jgi:hypothetical protein
MLRSRIKDSISVLNGFGKVLNTHLRITSNNVEHYKRTSQNYKDIKTGLNDLQQKFNENLIKDPSKIIVCCFLSVFTVLERNKFHCFFKDNVSLKANTFWNQTRIFVNSNYFNKQQKRSIHYRRFYHTSNKVFSDKKVNGNEKKVVENL